MTATCSAVLANRRRCDRPAGHGGRHLWIDIGTGRTRHHAALEELAEGRWPGETWRDWNDRVVALVEMAQREGNR